MENPMRVRYPTNEEIVTVGQVRDVRYTTVVFMSSLSDEELEKLTIDESIIINREGINHEVKLSNIYLAGSPNLKDKEDIDDIKSIGKWCSNIHSGSFIPRNYDYNTNTGDLVEVACNKKICAYVETFDNLKMFKFGYARLGCPKNVVLFKKIVLSR